MLSWLLKRVIQLCSKGAYGNKLNVLTYHRVDEFTDPLKPQTLSLSLLRSQLKWLKKYFNVLTLPEAIDLMEKGKLPAGAVCISIDDGYSDCYHHIYQVLKEESLKANFFITTEGITEGGLWDEYVVNAISYAPNTLRQIQLNNKFYDISTFRRRQESQGKILEIIKYMTLDERKDAITSIYEQTNAPKPVPAFLSEKQIKEMHDAGMTIGAHTHNHPIMQVEDIDVCAEQISKGRKILEDIIGEPVDYFAFPNGKINKDFNEQHCKLLEQLGFKGALSTNWGTLDNLTTDRFKIKRFTPWDETEWRFCFRLALNYRN